MRLKTILSILTLATLSAANVEAQSRGDDVPPGARSIAGVTLNRDSAASIRAKLGDTPARRLNTGHEIYVSWCYVTPGGSSSALLELMSDASDMGTPGQALNAIRLRADAPLAERQGCAPLHASLTLATPAGLRLGLDRATIRKLLGPPARARGDSLIYDYDAKQYMRPGTPEFQTWNTPENRESCFDAGPPYVNVEGVILIVFRDARAAELRIERYDRSVC